MDKIFKNDTVMGIIALTTFVLVAIMFVKNRKVKKTNTESPAATTAEE